MAVVPDSPGFMGFKELCPGGFLSNKNMTFPMMRANILT